MCFDCVHSKEFAERIAKRKLLKTTYPKIFLELTNIFRRHDPIRIGLIRWDEYAPEVGTVLPRLLEEAQSADDVLNILREEFARWFSGNLGRETVYAPMAQDVWEARNRIGAR